MRRSSAVVVVVHLVSLLMLLPQAPATAARCTITGTGHGDRLVGTAGRDVICGRGGDDILRGLGGNDVLIGGDGRDQLSPGSGRNTARGGHGRDTVRYDKLTSGMFIDLRRGTTSADATDTVAGIENVVGTSSDDRILGTSGSNVIEAGSGLDFINPGAGDDVVHGGGDRLARFHGDTLSYFGVGTGVRIDMANGTVDGPGHATFDGIVNVAGTDRDDELIAGDDPWTVILGLDGDDLITGTVQCGFFAAGRGDDTLVPGLPVPSCAAPGEVAGHDGIDSVTYADAAEPLVVEQVLGDRWKVTGVDASWGLAGEVEILVGTAFDDVLSGGLGSIAASFHGGGGVDEIDVTDGFGGDVVRADPGSSCVGDPTDDVSC